MLSESGKPTDANGREIRRGFVIRTEDGETRRVGSFYIDSAAPDDVVLITWDPARPYAPQTDVYGPAVIVRAATVEVIEPGPGSAAAASTDALLHRLREVVAEYRDMAPPLVPADLLVMVRAFDELDYRMSRRPYPVPSEWQR